MTRFYIIQHSPNGEFLQAKRMQIEEKEYSKTHN